jgi:hypothetical protein
MFSQCYQIGECIELFNIQDKKLFSKWGFTGKHSKVYDAHLRNYQMVLSTGNLSKMEIPKSSYNSKNKSLSLFQSYLVFQLYLFTSKQLTIEIAISDTENTKRRLIFSSNNNDLTINQLHCRIPILKFPIGRWVNFSIDILSFVSKCYKNLTFRSVDYISLSMSGKVRYIFTMRTPIIEKNNNFELDKEGNIINFNDENFNDISNGNSENSFVFGAKDIPDKYKFPPHEEVINMNMDCNKAFSQIYLENENKQIMVSQDQLFNKKPLLIQDTANAINMDKGLKFRHDVYMKNKKNNERNDIYEFYGNNQIFQNSNNLNYNNMESNNRINIINNRNKVNYLKNSKIGTYNKSSRFNNVGNLIMSQNMNNINNFSNKKSTYNLERNKLKLNLNTNNNFGGISPIQNNDINRNELDNEKEFINLSKEDNDNYNNDNGGGDILFNKEEYNRLYKNGQGVTSQIKKNLKINQENGNNVQFNDFDEKINYELSAIKNDNDNVDLNDNFYSNYNLDIDIDIENDKNNEEGNKKRPFSPPITKLE